MKLESLGIPNAIKIVGDQPGKKLVVFGAVHGDEPCGSMALQNFLFQLIAGDLLFQCGELVVVIANQEGLQLEKRYLEKNLNRLFVDATSLDESYEYRRARELMPLLQRADYFLDIHSTSRPTAPFLFSEKHLLSEAKLLGVPNIVMGWNDLAGADLGGDTESYANQHDVVSFTLECGQHKDSQTLQNAYYYLLAFLKLHGAIHSDAVPSVPGVQNVYQMFAVEKLYRADFQYECTPENFLFLAKDQCIGRDSMKSYLAPEDCYLIMPGNPSTTAVGEELFFLGRLYK